MRKEIAFCDICKKECQVKTKAVQTIFLTEQTEGRGCKPYFETFTMDVCEDCQSHRLKGNPVYGSGAQGHNTFVFNDSEVEKLRHLKDSVTGLWATDRPDLLTAVEKKKCHLFQIK